MNQMACLLVRQAIVSQIEAGCSKLRFAAAPDCHSACGTGMQSVVPAGMHTFWPAASSS